VIALAGAGSLRSLPSDQLPAKAVQQRLRHCDAAIPSRDGAGHRAESASTKNPRRNGAAFPWPPGAGFGRSPCSTTEHRGTSTLAHQGDHAPAFGGHLGFGIDGRGRPPPGRNPGPDRQKASLAGWRSTRLRGGDRDRLAWSSRSRPAQLGAVGALGIAAVSLALADRAW